MSIDSPTPAAIRLKRISFRAWHRGMKELDLILGRYADERLAQMSEGELAAFEEIIDLPDHTLYLWLAGREAIPSRHDTPLMREIKARCDLGASGV